MGRINLRSYDNSWYDPGRSAVWRFAWLFCGLRVLRSPWIVSSRIRIGLLRFFGARIGEHVVMRQPFRVKYPWHLLVGNDCWFGEDCWIDNLTTVCIGNDVCISQGAYLCTGNHNWSDPHFGLITARIHLEDGAWVGAHAIVGPGVEIGVGAVAGAGSLVIGNIPDFEVHLGNPARLWKHRSVGQPATVSVEALS